MFIIYRGKQFGFSLKTLFTLYVWFIRTSLEYAVPVWHPNLTSKQTAMLESIQKRCFRVILGHAYVNYDTALTILNTTTLEKRRIKLCYSFARKVLKSNRHRDLFPPLFNQVHGYATRRCTTLLPSVPSVRNRYTNSSVPYLVRLLNSNN